jgi:hypothetical protein
MTAVGASGARGRSQRSSLGDHLSSGNHRPATIHRSSACVVGTRQSRRASGGSIDAGIPAIIEAIDISRHHVIGLVEFLRNERLTGEAARLREIDLVPD